MERCCDGVEMWRGGLGRIVLRHTRGLGVRETTMKLWCFPGENFMLVGKLNTCGVEVL